MLSGTGCSPAQVEQLIVEIQARMQARIDNMVPSARQQFYDLQAEQGSLAAEAGRMEEMYGELSRVLVDSEGELNRNPLKQRALGVQVGGVVHTTLNPNCKCN